MRFDEDDDVAMDERFSFPRFLLPLSLLRSVIFDVGSGAVVQV